MSASRSRYSTAAILLHWTIAALIIFQFAYMFFFIENLERGDPAMGSAYELHKSIGITILALTLVRLVMRLTEGFKPLPAHMAPWEVFLARFTHIAFYMLLLIVPLTGWIFAVSPDRGLDLFGLFPVPDLGIGVRDAAHELHELLVWPFILLIVLHIVGALKHHFIDRDEVLARMLPFLSSRRV